ncbi:SixA phosphatase family protein [Cribrihabitans neustonicus]|uniref:SixA phosphatase family protein n=1 Tax=Cribrihabitans neustonicus TaxID=1429085 RepID=UPI003B5B6BD2
MTCTLILSRHAKSAWDTNPPSDHARPLNKRGRRSAPAIGAWLREAGQVPDQVIASSALRARETWKLMGLQAHAAFTERLYMASSEMILKELRQAEHPRVMVIGHNPGIAAFAHTIVSHPPGHARFDDFPTGATLIAEFAIDSWADLNWSSGTAVDFAVPRELLGE